MPLPRNRSAHPLATLLLPTLDPHPPPCAAGHLLACDAVDVHDLGARQAAGDRVGFDWDDDVCQPELADMGDEQFVVGDKGSWRCGW